jgi:hypothetical protein
LEAAEGESKGGNTTTPDTKPDAQPKAAPDAAPDPNAPREM